MICELCNHQASFLCLCSRLYLCSAHFDEHFMNQENHKFEQLFITLEPFAKSLLKKELDERISSLKTLKNQLIVHTENIIKTIEILHTSTLKNISRLLKKYKKINRKTNFSSSEHDEITDLMKTEMIFTKPASIDLQNNIKKFYSQPFFNIEVDSVKERNFVYKKFLQTHNGGFLCLAISKDGNTLLTGSEDTTVRVWDVVNMKQIACYAEHGSDVRCLALSNDSSLALSGSEDKTVILWDLKEKCHKKVLSEHSGTVLTVSFSVDEKLIISGSFGKEIILWNIEFNEVFKKISANDVICSGLVISKSRYITGTNDFLEIWDLITFKTIQSIKAHNESINSIATTNDNQFIITGSEDCLVKIWNTDSMSLYASHSEHRNTVWSVTVTPNDQEIISGSFDKSLILWNIKSKQTLQKFTFHKDYVLGVKSVNDTIFSVSRDSRIGITKISSNKFERFLTLKPFKAGDEFIKGNIITCGSLNDVIFCDIENEEIVLEGHSNLVNQVCISSNNEFLISTSGGSEKNLIVWDLKSKSIKALLDGHFHSVLSIDISSDNLNALSGDFFGQVRYWNLVNFNEEFLFKGHLGEVLTVKFTKSKTFAASGGEDLQVLIWDLERKTLHAQLSGHDACIFKVLITRDDKYIVSADFNDGIRIWDIEKLKQEHNFKDMDESKQWLDLYKELKGELIKFLI